MNRADLYHFQMSKSVPSNSMPLPELDCYLTGVVMTPLVTSVRDWMLQIWNGQPPSFQSQDELDEVVEAVRQRTIEIGSQLDDLSEDALDPIFFDSNGETVVTDWAEGVIQAVDVYRQAWQPVLVSSEGQRAVAPIAANSVDEQGKSPFGLEIPDWRELRKQGPEGIVRAIVDIEEFWRQRDLKEQEEHEVFSGPSFFENRR